MNIFPPFFGKKVAVLSVWFGSYWHWQKIDMEYFFSIGPKEMKCCNVKGCRMLIMSFN